MHIPPSFNMTEHVLQAGRKTPHKVALQVVGGDPFAMTYAGLEAAILGTAAGLLEEGASPGDRILLRLDNSPLFPICYLAAIAVGLIPVPTSPQLTQVEVDKCVQLISPTLTLASPGLAVPPRIRAIMDEDLKDMQYLEPAEIAYGDPHRPGYIVFTSGTGGTPRAVVHAHRAVLARQMMFDGWYGLQQSDRLMHAGAFNWTYTMGTGLIDPWTLGATSLIPAPVVDPASLIDLIAAHDVSIFAAAPGVYRKFPHDTPHKLPKLRHGLSAGEKLPDVTRLRWTNATQTPIFEAYGMSECSTFISGCPTKPAPDGTLGYAQKGRTIKLLQDGMIGVHKSDPGLMLGYYNDPDATAEKFKDNWFLTGDIGRETEDGAIAYEGRADDMINAGGLRVSPVELETALATCAPAQDWACAEVRLKEDVSLIAAFHAGPDVIDEDTLKDALRQQLAAYKIPRLFITVDALPRGANNKLLRRKLRQDWETAHGQT